MNAILIKSDSEANLKLLAELGIKLGGNVFNFTEEEYEDLALGLLMDKVKTSVNVSRKSIMVKLKKK